MIVSFEIKGSFAVVMENPNLFSSKVYKLGDKKSNKKDQLTFEYKVEMMTFELLAET